MRTKNNCNDVDMLMIQAKVDMDRKIIDYLDTHKAERERLEDIITALEFHSCVLSLIDKARGDGTLKISPNITTNEVFSLIAKKALGTQ